MFEGDGLHAAFYDQLFGAVPSVAGDIAFYDAMAGAGPCRILDAACGTGRIFAGLARPGRRIAAFDASASLLRAARQRAVTEGAPVEVTQQRLESFSLNGIFDLIVVGYYGFSCLLHAAARSACLQRFARHLAPDGRAVLHLPAPELLVRDVPAHEIVAMRAMRCVSNDDGERIATLEHRVVAMRYDPGERVRTIETEVAILDADGRPLRSERAAIRYACITEHELREAAGNVGLRVIETRSGLAESVHSELVGVLAHKHSADPARR